MPLTSKTRREIIETLPTDECREYNVAVPTESPRNYNEEMVTNTDSYQFHCLSFTQTVIPITRHHQARSKR
jgi:hypothetical protein